MQAIATKRLSDPRPALWIVLSAVILIASRSADAAGLAVIVNPQSGVQQMSKAEVIHIFMGRQKRLPSGAKAVAVDQGAETAAKADFYARLVGKDLSEINSYWARLIFSGQGSPPMQAESADDVVEIVGNNKGAIGYVDSGQADERVKIVFTLSD